EDVLGLRAFITAATLVVASCISVAYKLLDCKTQLKRFQWVHPMHDETSEEGETSKAERKRSLVRRGGEGAVADVPGPHARVVTVAWADSQLRAGLAWRGRGVPTPALKFHHACRFFEAASLLAEQSGLRLSGYARLGQRSCKG